MFFSLETQRQKTNVRSACFFIANLTSENQHRTNVFFSLETWHQGNMFLSSGILHQKSGVKRMCFSLGIGLTANIVFSLEIRRLKTCWMSDQCFVFIWKLMLENGRWTCFIYRKSDVGKETLGLHIYFIRNSTSVNEDRSNVLFSLETQCWKINVGQCCVFWNYGI